jgi:macrodomain Ter protein organizer (MatP/YcbG family)
MFRLCEGQAEEDIAEYIESAMKKVKVKHDGKLSSTNRSHSVKRWAVQHLQDKLPSHVFVGFVVG